MIDHFCKHLYRELVVLLPELLNEPTRRGVPVGAVLVGIQCRAGAFPGCGGTKVHVRRHMSHAALILDRASPNGVCDGLSSGPGFAASQNVKVKRKQSPPN